MSFGYITPLLENVERQSINFKNRYGLKLVDYRMKLATQLVVNKKRHSA